jgi:hypothetical protein
MVPRLTGTIRLDTPGAARKFVRPIASKIAWELENQAAGHIRESGNVVSFRRGYTLQSQRGLFISFDPGQFVVEAGSTNITIRYTLGLGPMLFVLALLPLGFAYALYVSRELDTILTVFAIIVMVFGAGFAINLWKIRSWLRTAADAAIKNASGPKE